MINELRLKRAPLFFHSSTVVNVLVVLCIHWVACGRVGFKPPPLKGPSPGVTDGSVAASCLDKILNQNEEQVDCGGDCPPCANATSCSDLLAKRPNATSQVYELDIDGESGLLAPFFAYCEMVADGGGWTLIAKMDGAKQTFAYDGVAWTDDNTINETLPDLDDNEAKLRSYAVLPFNDIRLGMKVNGVPHWIVLTASQLSGAGVAPFSSFGALMRLGTNVATAIGRAQWLTLIGASAIQLNCNREGFNVNADNQGHPRVRIGILGNNETDCIAPDSFLGFGGQTGPFTSPAAMFDTVVGNGAVYNSAGGGDRNTYAIGYIMVR